MVSAVRESRIQNHKFGLQCIFDIVVVNSSTRMKYELLPHSLHVLDKYGISSGDAGSTSMERGVKNKQDFMDLSICTREKLAHVRDCKTGTQCYVTYLFNVTKSCLRNSKF